MTTSNQNTQRTWNQIRRRTKFLLPGLFVVVLLLLMVFVQACAKGGGATVPDNPLDSGTNMITPSSTNPGAGSVTSDDPTGEAAPSNEGAAGSEAAPTNEGYCGDDILDTTKEQCEVGDLNNATCENMGLGTGTVSCDLTSCTYITSMCVPATDTAGAGASSY